MQTTSITIRGYVVGNIWMPNAECYKEFNYDVLRERDTNTVSVRIWEGRSAAGPCDDRLG